MLTDVELLVLLPLDRAMRALVWRYVAWCYATNVYIPATTYQVAPGWACWWDGSESCHRMTPAHQN